MKLMQICCRHLHSNILILPSLSRIGNVLHISKYFHRIGFTLSASLEDRVKIVVPIYLTESLRSSRAKASVRFTLGPLLMIISLGMILGSWKEKIYMA